MAIFPIRSVKNLVTDHIVSVILVLLIANTNIFDSRYEHRCKHYTKQINFWSIISRCCVVARCYKSLHTFCNSDFTLDYYLGQK